MRIWYCSVDYFLKYYLFEIHQYSIFLDFLFLTLLH